MADKETPQIPGGETPQVNEQEPTSITDPQEAGKALLAELEGLGVTDTDQLHGMARASAEVGNMANKLGEERQRRMELEAQIAAMGSQRRRPEPDYFDDDFTQDKPMTKADLKAFFAEEQAKAFQFQQAQMRQYAEVQSDPDFRNPQIKAVWDAHITNPNVQSQIQLGQTTPQREFDRVSKRYYRQIALKSKETITGLMGQNSPRSTVPHVESGETRSIQLPPEADERTQRITKLAQGPPTEENIDAMFAEMLPDNDPIWRS